jgi:hypothetical protein
VSTVYMCVYIYMCVCVYVLGLDVGFLARNWATVCGGGLYSVPASGNEFIEAGNINRLH